MSRGEKGALKAALGLLARMLNGETLTVDKAGENYGFAAAAVRQHLNALAEIVPGIVKKGRPAAWQFRPTQGQQATSMLWALAVARELLAGFRDSGIGVHLDALLKDTRLSTGGPPPGDLSRMVHSLSGLHAADAKILDLAMAAIMASEQIEFEYCHFGGDEDRVTLEPYSLIVHDDSTYLYGRCGDSANDHHIDTHRLYNLRRVTGLKRTTTRFAYPVGDAYDPAEKFEHCFGGFLPRDGQEAETVELAFDPAWRSFLSRHPKHHSQLGPDLREDGRVRLTLHVYVSFDLVHWLRGHGNAVEVIRPPHLARWVASGEGTKWKDPTDDSE